MQQVWRKRIRNTGWIALGAVTLVLLVSAVYSKNHKECTGIEVSFNKDGNNFFADEKGIVAILKSYGNIKGKQLENIDLKVLEQRLESDRWIANAELFFDNKQVLQVIVEENEPVARIFTVAGSSFYIDSACKKLPLSQKLSARIPMFTSFPSERVPLSRPDSQLLALAKDLAMFVRSDDFWKAQIAQLDITTNGFEMIPTIGSHVVALGRDGNWQQKFDRLFSFYKQVWTQVGLEKYEKLDVQFDGQVVATMKGAKPARIDSVKARMAYENLLAEVKSTIPKAAALKEATESSDTARSTNVSNNRTPVKNVEAIKILPSKTTLVKHPAQKTEENSAPVKTPLAKPTVTKPANKPATTKQVILNKKTDEKRVPKAVMAKKIK